MELGKQIRKYWNELGISQDMLAEKIKNAIDEMRDSGDTELCEDLIRIYGVQIPDFAEAAFALDIFYPYILYQDAAPELRNKMIDLLENGQEESDVKYYHLLNALAMIEDEVAVQAIKKWQKHPRPWCGQLKGGPLANIEEAGWCIEDGQVRQLYFNECYGLEKTENDESENNVFGGTCAEKCPWCGWSYIHVVIDGRDERLSFLGIHGKIKIKYCESCIPWAKKMFCRYKEDGESTILFQDGEAGPFFDDEDLNSRPPFILSKKMVPKNYCDEFERCAIGGRPAFIYGAGYLTCPECGRKMKHLAQLGDIWTDCGTHYIQICRDCKIAGVTYQQT